MTQQNLPELPSLPQGLLDDIANYGLSRSDKDSEPMRIHKWTELINSVKKYATDYALAALSSQGAGEAVLQKAESALDKLDQWLLDGCPGGPWVALEPLGVIRESLKTSCRQASQPTDLVPLRIEYEPGYPEDVAFGTQMQMDRLKKWLDKFFAMRAAEAAQPPIEQAVATCQNCNGSGSVVVMSDASPDAHETEVECPHCAGTGALEDAYQGVVKLLQQMTAKWYQALPFEVAHQNKSNEAAQPARVVENEGDTLEDNVRYLLDRCPYTVRDMSGERTGARGVEYLAGSLAITFLGMQSKLSTPPTSPAICGMPVVVDESIPADQIKFVQPAPTPSQAGAVTELETQLAEAFKHLDDAYCRVGSPTTAASRHADRIALVKGRAALAAFEAKKAGGANGVA